MTFTASQNKLNALHNTALPKSIGLQTKPETDQGNDKGQTIIQFTHLYVQ